MTQLRVSAEEVVAMANYMGVNLKAGEYWLVAIARAAAEAEVPPPWKEEEDDQGNPYFVNPKTGKSSRRHPMDKLYLELVHSARRRGPPPDNDTQTWMSFTSEEGVTTYHNFASNTDSEATPERACMIPELPEVKRPKYGGSRMEPTTLETRTKALKHLQHLTFFVGWFEDIESTDLTFRVDSNNNVGGGLRKRHMTITFDLNSNQCGVEMDEDGQRVRLSNVQAVTADFGMPVQCWDLYVGGQVVVLGKKVVLSSASQETISWLDVKSKQVHRLKEELQRTIIKYDTKAIPTSITFPRGCLQKDRHGRSELQPGATMLRYTVEKTQVLIEELSKFRPAVAAKKGQELEHILSSS